MPKLYSGDLYSAVLSKLYQAAKESAELIDSGAHASEWAYGFKLTNREVVALEGVLGWNYHERIKLRDEIAKLKAEIEKLRKAVDFIAEGIDVGRHDGLPEDGPAHDADTMFAVARDAQKKKGA
jgi:hypothetical protein